MARTNSSSDRIRGALFGMFIGDAMAMPVHWYYDTKALRRDHGKIINYQKPRNPHPDSILWRSSFPVKRGAVDILHDQRSTGGRRVFTIINFFRRVKTLSMSNWPESF
jgi:ADP-ribosyl-[dinitrogen reductase] hydrolase